MVIDMRPDYIIGGEISADSTATKRMKTVVAQVEALADRKKEHESEQEDDSSEDKET